MAAIATQVVDRDGLSIIFSNAAAGGDTVTTGRQSTLLIKNDDASSKTVTLITPGTVDGLAVADRAVVVAAGEIQGISLDRDLYGDTDGIASMTYSAVTNLKVAVILR